MSHEIRTPMNGIIGMTELALDTSLTLEQREYLTTALDSSKSLLMIVNDILDLSKIESGKLDLDSLEFNPRQLLASVTRPLELDAAAKGLRLLSRVNGNVPEQVCGDSLRLRQVLTNLIGNAIKFTEHGHVKVFLDSPVTSGSPSSGVQLQFSIADTGIGIPADKQAAIFEPFMQADGSMTRNYGGSGLGLTISAKLVAMMGGRVWLDSAPGEGSTFYFTVDCASVLARRDNPAVNAARSA